MAHSLRFKTSAAKQLGRLPKEARIRIGFEDRRLNREPVSAEVYQTERSCLALANPCWRLPDHRHGWGSCPSSARHRSWAQARNLPRLLIPGNRRGGANEPTRRPAARAG